MIVYQLHIAPGEDDGEGEDHDEWFGSLEAAKRRRAELIRLNPTFEGHRYGADFKIEKVKLRGALSKQLILNVLNRHAYVEEAAVVVPEYVPATKGAR